MKKLIYLAAACLLLASALNFSGCQKIQIRQTTTEDVNMLQYLEQDSLQRFTELVQIIQKAGYTSFMNAYGTYTLFAPTDSAIDAYLKQKKIASIDALPVDSMKSLLKLHLLNEEIYTSNFNDGKLPSVTMYGQFLVTQVKNINGAAAYIVNRQATITEPNIQTGNGVIQVINNVLTPSIYTIAQLVDQDPDYSIFDEALKATGYYDTLNTVTVLSDSTTRWFTLIAEPNEALADSGIYSYQDLKARYSNTGDPTNPSDSLNLYVAYHIIPGNNYLADIVMSNSHSTMAPLQVITDKVRNDTVLLNDDQYSTLTGIVYEPGIPLDQSKSDVSATNGVMHRALTNLVIKVRNPFPVYWDLCATVPELTRLASVYRKETYLFQYGDGNTLSTVKWEKSCLKYRAGVKGYLGDYWEIGFGTSSSNTNGLGTCEGNSWIQFTTPLLVAGKYKVWVCYYTQNTSKVVAVQASFDSIPLTSALIQFNQKISSVSPDQESSLEAIGWKWWAGSSQKSGSTVARMVGIVDVKVTGNHTIRFDLVSGSNSDCNLDMIQFIPIGMNQTSPRFNSDGSIEY